MTEQEFAALKSGDILKWHEADTSGTIHTYVIVDHITDRMGGGRSVTMVVLIDLSTGEYGDIDSIFDAGRPVNLPRTRLIECFTVVPTHD